LGNIAGRVDHIKRIAIADIAAFHKFSIHIIEAGLRVWQMAYL
jgi:hypothetical protein